MEFEDVLRETIEGSYVAKQVSQTSDEITGQQAADALYAAGSDLEFFDLDDNGDARDNDYDPNYGDE
jgi:hypothetical protein